MMRASWFTRTASTAEAAQVEAAVAEFGQDVRANPVRTKIAILRAQRDAGELDETDWAVKVEELLGAVDPAPLASQASLVD
jgi:hypothetical protein